MIRRSTSSISAARRRARARHGCAKRSAPPAPRAGGWPDMRRWMTRVSRYRRRAAAARCPAAPPARRWRPGAGRPGPAACRRTVRAPVTVAEVPSRPETSPSSPGGRPRPQEAPAPSSTGAAPGSQDAPPGHLGGGQCGGGLPLPGATPRPCGRRPAPPASSTAPRPGPQVPWSTTLAKKRLAWSGPSSAPRSGATGRSAGRPAPGGASCSPARPALGGGLTIRSPRRCMTSLYAASQPPSR